MAASPQQTKRAAYVGTGIVAALAFSVPLAQYFEGLVLTPGHHDPAGYADVCYGDRAAQNRPYTPDECAAQIIARQAKDYAPAVLSCVPKIAEKSKVFAASIDAAYNAGAAAFCKSPMAQKFNANDWRGGCNAFHGWRVTAKGVTYPGLVKRREAEKALCLSGIA